MEITSKSYLSLSTEFSTVNFEKNEIQLVDIRKTEKSNADSTLGNVYRLEITNCGDSKMKMAELLSCEFKIRFREAMDKLNNVPCCFNENVEKRIFNVLLEEIDDTSVEYCLYENNKIISSKGTFKKVEEIPQRYSVKNTTNVRYNRKQQEKEEKEAKSNARIKKLLILSFILMLLYFMFLGYKVDKNDLVRENEVYYNSIEPIMNIEDFCGYDRSDVQAIYGVPNNKELDNANWYYDFGDYELQFHFIQDQIDFIAYRPVEAFEYKNSPKDVLCLFGLKDKLDDFNDDGVNDLIYYYNDEELKLSTTSLNEDVVKVVDYNVNLVDEQDKTVGYVSVYLYNEFK